VKMTKNPAPSTRSNFTLSKGLVIVQTGWFVLQCIARHVEGLPITELELMTLAFATLNFFTYGLWLDKPLSVQRPYRVLVKRKRVNEEEDEVNKEEDDVQGIGMCTVARALPEMIHKATTTTWSAIGVAVGYIRENGVWGTIGNGVVGAFSVSMSPFWEMMSGSDDNDVTGKKVYTFYGGELTNTEEIGALSVGSGIAALFGVYAPFHWVVICQLSASGCALSDVLQ